MARKSTEELRKADLAHVIHDITPFGVSSGVIFERSAGQILIDTNGKEYIDFIAGLENVNIGHGRKELAESVATQMRKHGYSHTFYGNSHTAVIECAEKLAKLTPPGLKHFTFSCGGGEAVETAMKIARFYWYHKGMKNKVKIIGQCNSYHGVTLGSLSLMSVESGRGDLADGFGPKASGFIHIPSYYCYGCAFGKSYPHCNIECARNLEKTIEAEGEDNIAAFLTDPVQGSFGVVVPVPEYWPMVREICTKHNVLLIDDEVMTGFGRTGKMFCIEHWNIIPDIMAMSKGIVSGYLPFGATAISDEIFDELKGKLFVHGFTQGTNPSCCACAIANLDILVSERLTENAAKIGRYLLDRLQEFKEFQYVGEVQGLGCMLRVELVKDKTTKEKFPPELGVGAKVVAQALEKGIIVREYFDRIAIGPCLNITIDECDKALDILRPIIRDLKP